MKTHGLWLPEGCCSGVYENKHRPALHIYPCIIRNSETDIDSKTLPVHLHKLEGPSEANFATHLSSLGLLPMHHVLALDLPPTLGIYNRQLLLRTATSGFNYFSRQQNGITTTRPATTCHLLWAGEGDIPSGPPDRAQYWSSHFSRSPLPPSGKLSGRVRCKRLDVKLTMAFIQNVEYLSGRPT